MLFSLERLLLLFHVLGIYKARVFTIYNIYNIEILFILFSNNIIIILRKFLCISSSFYTIQLCIRSDIAI